MQDPLLGRPRAEAPCCSRQLLLLLGAPLGAVLLLCYSASSYLAERPVFRTAAPRTTQLLFCDSYVDEAVQQCKSEAARDLKDCHSHLNHCRTSQSSIKQQAQQARDQARDQARECKSTVGNYEGKLRTCTSHLDDCRRGRLVSADQATEYADQLKQCSSHLDACRNDFQAYMDQARDKARDQARECKINISNYEVQLQDCHRYLGGCNSDLVNLKNDCQVHADQARAYADQLNECNSHLGDSENNYEVCSDQQREFKITARNCTRQLQGCERRLGGCRSEHADADRYQQKVKQLQAERKRDQETISKLETHLAGWIFFGVSELIGFLALKAWSVYHERQRRQRLEERQRNPTMYDLILDTDSFRKMLATKFMEVIRDSARLQRLFGEGAAKLAQVCSDKVLQLFATSLFLYKIVAVAGKYDAGKTWLLNKLLELDFPSGKTCRTYGISMYERVLANNRSIVVADSAGTHVPNDQRSRVTEATDAASLSKLRKSELEDRVLDAHLSEGFRLELIGRLADCVIYVANDFSPLDEQQIMQICGHALAGGRDASLRTIFVVHNLKDVDTVEEALQVWQSQVLDKFVSQPCRDENLLHCTVQGGESNKVIRHHIGLCKEGSPAGERFNDKGIATLKEEVLFNFGKISTPLCKLIEEATEKMWEARVRGKPGHDELEVTWEPDGHGAGGFRLRNLGDELFESAQELQNGEIAILDSRLNLVHNLVKSETSPTEFQVVVECPGCTSFMVELCTNDKELKLEIEKEKALGEQEALLPEIPMKEAWGTWRKSIQFPRAVTLVMPTDENGAALRDSAGQELPYTIHNGILTVKLKYKDVAPPRQSRSAARGSREPFRPPVAEATMNGPAAALEPSGTSDAPPAPAQAPGDGAAETSTMTPLAQHSQAPKSLEPASVAQSQPSRATLEPEAESPRCATLQESASLPSAAAEPNGTAELQVPSGEATAAVLAQPESHGPTGTPRQPRSSPSEPEAEDCSSPSSSPGKRN